MTDTNKKENNKVIKLKPEDLSEILENFADDQKVQDMLKRGENPFEKRDKKKYGGIVKSKKPRLRTSPKIALRGF